VALQDKLLFERADFGKLKKKGFALRNKKRIRKLSYPFFVCDLST
jgi:hypothetical protein